MIVLGIPKVYSIAFFVGSGSIVRALKGKHYIYAIQKLEYAYDALLPFKVIEFENWLDDKNHPTLDAITATYEFQTCLKEVRH